MGKKLGKGFSAMRMTLVVVEQDFVGKGSYRSGFLEGGPRQEGGVGFCGGGGRVRGRKGRVRSGGGVAGRMGE